MFDYFLQNIIPFSLFFGGGILGLTIVLKINTKYMIEPSNSYLQEKNIRNYELLYYDEFEALDDISYEKDDLINFKFKDVKDKTPMGKVIMTYDVLSESFWYYSNNNIPYKILDTLARKFSIENNCKSICVNYREEYYKGTEKLKIKNQEVEDKLKKKLKDIYIQLKSYNSKDKSKDNYILTNNANRFTLKGKIEDYYSKPKINENKDISYKDFIKKNKIS